MMNWFFFIEIVPQTIQEEMQTIYISLSELLRHFWSSFPPSSPQIEEKVGYDVIIRSKYSLFYNRFIVFMKQSNDFKKHKSMHSKKKSPPIF